ncbi:hypothetical protein V8G54_000070 (mitochondrion) [Vigna mungo]|uniref:Uncharacterized protein n=1 Tax=Vigna mungo TaxID=3915 RepID=A0AAQ3PG08_VIGMU
MLFMISAHDSIAMYLAIEPQSLCFYVMAASKRNRLEIFDLRCIFLWNLTVWPWVGLCLDLLRAKSEGLVPMEIPLGLIPRLMTYLNWEAWRKVKIEGKKYIDKNSLLGQRKKKGPDTSTRGATSWFTKPRPSVTRSPGPKGSSAQLPTPSGIALSEPSQEWPLVDTHHFSPGPERLGHRNLDRLRAGKRKPPRPDQSQQQCRIRPPLALNSQAATSFPKINKGRSAAYCSRKHPTYTIVKSSAYLSDIRYLIAIKGNPLALAHIPVAHWADCFE